MNIEYSENILNLATKFQICILLHINRIKIDYMYHTQQDNRVAMTPKQMHRQAQFE